VSFAHYERRTIENFAICSDLGRKTLKGIRITLDLIAVKITIYYSNVDPTNTVT
jgi:hypothetical protein